MIPFPRKYLAEVLRYSPNPKIIAYICPQGVIWWHPDGSIHWQSADGGFKRILPDGS